MRMKETEQKIKGQWFTPENVADEMVNMTPDTWWTKGILEPTCGNGNLVIRILNEKVKHGLTPEEALNTTFANEFDEKYAIECTERVREWAEDKGIHTQWTCMNEDAQTYDFSKIPYEYVWTNLPFGSWGGANSYLPNFITKNVVKSEGILITKPSTYKKFVKEYKIVDFPGIVFKVQISYYDLKCTESKSWTDKYKSIMTDEKCKWEVNDNSYTHVISLLTSRKKIMPIYDRSIYDKKGKLPAKCILLKLTDDEYNKLISYKIPELYNEYDKEHRMYCFHIHKKIIISLINEALSS